MTKETPILDRLLDRFAEWTKYGWFASALIVPAVGWAYKIVTGFKTPFGWESDIQDLVVLTVLAGMSGGLWGYVHRFKKYQEEGLSSVSRDLISVRTNQPILELCYTLPHEQRDSVIKYGAQKKTLKQLVEGADQSVQGILQELSDDYERRIAALSNGQIDIPLNQSPSVNAQIISTFGKRMDAVSRDGLAFWTGALGESYLKMSSTDLPEGGSPELSRIFILDRTEIKHESNQLAKIFERHLSLKIGFAIAIDNSLTPLKATHRIREESSYDNLSPRLDFALFEKDLAVTFFRKELGAGHFALEDGKRFRAAFKIHDAAHPNNEVIQNQRKIWVDLIPELWLVSERFWPIVEGNLNEEEKRKIKDMAFRKNAKRAGKIKEDFDSDYFPLVAHEPTDFMQKLTKLQEWYDRFDPPAHI